MLTCEQLGKIYERLNYSITCGKVTQPIHNLAFSTNILDFVFHSGTGALLLPNHHSESKKTDNNSDYKDELQVGYNALKGKPRLSEEDLSHDIIQTMEHNICSFVTYKADTVDCLTNFECIKSNTECLFAKRAKLWGSPQWKEQLNLEENVLR